MILSAIVAYTKDKEGKQIIGKDGGIPWNIPKDMRWFREQTLHSAIVMGRKTFESIGRVLPGRDNIIVTRQTNYNVPGAHVFHDLDKAIEFAGQRNPEVFIIGGEELYRQTIDRVDRIYVTFIKKNPGFEGDTFFPSWARAKFKPIHSELYEDPECGVVSFKIFQRIEYQKRAIDQEVDSTYSSQGTGI